MGLFSAFVKVALDVAEAPLAIVKDAVTLGNLGEGKTHTRQLIEKMREDAEDADRD